MLPNENKMSYREWERVDADWFELTWNTVRRRLAVSSTVWLGGAWVICWSRSIATSSEF